MTKQELREWIDELDFISGELYDQVYYDYEPYEFNEYQYKIIRNVIEYLKQSLH